MGEKMKENKEVQKRMQLPEAVYRLLAAEGIKKEDMLHVAGSVFDVMGAKAAGCNCAWSNRYSDYVLDPKFEPDYNMKNLSELLNFL